MWTVSLVQRWGYYYGGGWWWWWWVVWFVVLIGIIWLAVWLARRGRRFGVGAPPEEILRRRYARGEIDRETYQRMLEDIRRPPGGTPKQP